MKTAVFLDYKLTRVLEKWFFTGILLVICGLGWVFFLNYLLIKPNSIFACSVSSFFSILYCSKAEPLSFKSL